jgi:acyl-coenzyme A synthetase/AMP-(fatty) acid ligase
MGTTESARNLYVDPSREAPHSVTFVKELAKTATGKIQKYVSRAQRPAIAPE